jgi:hypothetical protein
MDFLHSAAHRNLTEKGKWNRYHLACRNHLKHAPHSNLVEKAELETDLGHNVLQDEADSTAICSVVAQTHTVAAEGKQQLESVPPLTRTISSARLILYQSLGASSAPVFGSPASAKCATASRQPFSRCLKPSSWASIRAANSGEPLGVSGVP